MYVRGAELYRAARFSGQSTMPAGSRHIILLPLVAFLTWSRFGSLSNSVTSAFLAQLLSAARATSLVQSATQPKTRPFGACLKKTRNHFYPWQRNEAADPATALITEASVLLVRPYCLSKAIS
jgi:hypothetical protein